MALVIKEIETDLALRSITPVVHAVQGDINRVLQVNFKMNKAPYNVEGLSYSIQYSKPDGTGGSYDTLPDGNAAGALEGTSGAFYLAPQVLTVPGIVKMNIALINSAMTIHTFSVTIDVEKNPGYGFESDDYVNLGGIQRVYDLDLREVTDFDIDSSDIQSTVITDLADCDAVFAAAADGKVIRLQTKDSANGYEIQAYLTDLLNIPGDSGNDWVINGTYWNGSTTDDLSHFQIIHISGSDAGSTALRWLPNRFIRDGKAVLNSGWDPNMYLGTDAEGNVVAVAAPEGGGTDVLAKDIQVVKSGSTITLTTTLEDDTQSVTDIALDENGYPVTVTTDGEACSVGWEGFDTTETAALPVVELSETLTTELTQLTAEESAILTAAAGSWLPCIVKKVVISGFEDNPVSIVVEYVPSGDIMQYQATLQNIGFGIAFICEDGANWFGFAAELN